MRVTVRYLSTEYLILKKGVKIMKRSKASKVIAAMLILSLAAMPAGQAAAAPESGTEVIEAAAPESVPAVPDGASEGGSIADSDIAVTNEIIVVYDDAGASEAKSEKIKEQAEDALSDMDAEITDEVADPNDQQGTVVVAELPEDVKIEEAIEQIEADDNVLSLIHI